MKRGSQTDEKKRKNGKWVNQHDSRKSKKGRLSRRIKKKSGNKKK